MAELAMPPVAPGGPWAPMVIEYRVPPSAIQHVCSGLGGPAYACMALSSDRSTCIIWLPQDSPPWLVEHERLHCQGYLHYPGTDLLFDPTQPHNAPRVADLLRFYRRIAGIVDASH